MNQFNTHGILKYISSHYKVNISNDKAELYEKMCLLNCWLLLL